MYALFITLITAHAYAAPTPPEPSPKRTAAVADTAKAWRQAVNERHGRLMDHLWERGAAVPRFAPSRFELVDIRKVAAAWLPAPKNALDIERREALAETLTRQISSLKRIHDRDELEAYRKELGQTYLNRLRLLDRALATGDHDQAASLRADVLRVASESYLAASVAKPERREYPLYIDHHHRRLMSGALVAIAAAGLAWSQGYHAHPYALLSTAVLPIVAGVLKWLDVRRLRARSPLRASMARVDYWLNRRWMRTAEVDLFAPTDCRRVEFSEEEMRRACDVYLAIDRSTNQSR